MIIWPRDVVFEVFVTILLILYVLVVVSATLPLYRFMISRGIGDYSARYYNRKVIHIMAGGLVAILVPYIYTSPVLPLIASLSLALVLAIIRRRALLYWFQVPENYYEINFLIAWGAAVFILWHVTGNPFAAVLPPILISFGDAVTGLVRNTIFRRRTKHWVGNIAMAMLSIPIGYIYMGGIGLIAASIASIIERYEFGPVDDNILIALSSALTIAAPHILGLV